MSDAPANAASRRMKYPYTYTAKLAQFPYKFYFTNSWLYKYWLVGMVVSAPIFYKIHKAGMYDNKKLKLFICAIWIKIGLE